MEREITARWSVPEVPNFEPTGEFTVNSKLQPEFFIYKTTIKVKKGSAAKKTFLYAKATSQGKPILFEFITPLGYTEQAFVVYAATPAPDPNQTYDILNLSVLLSKDQIALLTPPNNTTPFSSY